LIGVPLGIAALAAASPFWIRTAIATFLIAYAAYQLVWRSKRSIGSWGGRRADSAVGIAGGFLGGFAGLSGPLPLIWLHMRGGDSSAQRAIYQTFNVVVLMLATIGMAVGTQLPYSRSRCLAFPRLCWARGSAHASTSVSPTRLSNAPYCYSCFCRAASS
jgi:uncharacterized membrane protein YfcA